MAFKFPAQQATTRLVKIAVNVGRTGAVTPYAVLEPVLLSGSTIQLATLHNEQEIARKDLREGDLVLVEKGGDVIPKVVRPIPAGRPEGSVPWQMPGLCPACGSHLHKPEDEVVWRCPNTSCPAKLRRGLLHFASRRAMDIEGLGESLADQVVERGLVRDFSDLYRLDVNILANLTTVSMREGKPLVRRFGEKSAAKLVDQLERSKTRDLWRVVYAIGIRHVGERGAQALAGTFGSVQALIDARTEALETVPDVGPVVARSVRAFFDEPRNVELMRRLGTAGMRLEGERTTPPSGPLLGQTFVLTGTLASMTRDEAAAAIEARGGRVSSSVSKRTTYVVEGAEAGSKREKAQKLGVVILDEDAFRQLIGL
jgi:DNA ligase (NAD+)